MRIFDTALTYTYDFGFEVSAHGSDMSLSALSLKYIDIWNEMLGKNMWMRKYANKVLRVVKACWGEMDAYYYPITCYNDVIASQLKLEETPPRAHGTNGTNTQGVRIIQYVITYVYFIIILYLLNCSW